MAKMQDMRKTIETSLGNLNTTRAQEIAKTVLDKDAAKDQMSKTAADLVERSQNTWTKLVEVVRGEVRDQLRQMGVATEEEVNALGSAFAIWNGRHARPAPVVAARRPGPRRPPRRKRRRLLEAGDRQAGEPERVGHRAGVTRRRLDAELVRRGLMGTPRRRARRWRRGRAGRGIVASKPATMVADDVAISMLGASRPFVSRAGRSSPPPWIASTSTRWGVAASTPGRPPVGSPMSCYAAARPKWWRSTWDTGSWRGSCAPILA